MLIPTATSLVDAVLPLVSAACWLTRGSLFIYSSKWVPNFKIVRSAPG